MLAGSVSKTLNIKVLSGEIRETWRVLLLGNNHDNRVHVHGWEAVAIADI